MTKDAAESRKGRAVADEPAVGPPKFQSSAEALKEQIKSEHAIDVCAYHLLVAIKEDDEIMLSDFGISRL